MKHLLALKANLGLFRVCAFSDGLPLSGKGKFAQYLCDHYGWHHDSMGDYCRAEKKRGNALFDGTITGHMIPDAPIIDYGSRQLINASISGCNLYHPDGWRRNTNQNPRFIAIAKSNCFLPICIQFTTPADVCIARVEEAANEREHRQDTNKAIKRILEWNAMNAKVFEQTRQMRDAKQVDLIEVDNTNMAPEETAHVVLTQLDQIIGFHLMKPASSKPNCSYVPASSITDGQPVEA